MIVIHGVVVDSDVVVVDSYVVWLLIVMHGVVVDSDAWCCC